jgi:N-acetylmuramoyl-L-alanine amidase
MLARPLLIVLAACAIAPAAAGAAVHTVEPGETLWDIAAVNGMSTSTLAAANGLSPETHVITGTNLTIPALGAPVTATAPTTTSAPVSTSSGAPAGSIRVQPGDTLSGIAARQGVSTASLAALNGMSPGDWVIAGTGLRLPAGGSAPTATPSGAGAPAAMGGYTVRPGDTLSGLAAASRVSAAQIAFMNGLSPDAHIIAGTVLKLPTGAAIASSAPAPATTVVPQAPPVASPGRLSAGEVSSLAAQQGVPGSLAAAIGWQESGFNNAMVSPANARGIMQIVPGTWEWVQANLASSHLDPSSPTDNVRAGSLYLAHLLRETGGDASVAAAAYYQGLDSVRRIGMLPETQRYVANVNALRARFGG